ncbi:RNA polymerase II-specific transcription factor-like protein [Microdochium nivale]|nr:RNA polymerase II-specific transcription factor-like protein [Microdochium nivale]
MAASSPTASGGQLHPPSPSPPPQPAKGSPRQACDACRLRKRRCSVAAGSGRCHNCERAGAHCTFLLPLRARGPKPGRKSAHAGAAWQVGVEVEAGAGAEVEIAAQGGRAQSPRPPPPPSIPPVHETERIPRAGTPATVGTAAAEDGAPGHATDMLLPRELVRLVLDDYVRFVYPLLPVVHCPSFAADLEDGRDGRDGDFLALVVSLCAATVGLLPSRLAAYQALAGAAPGRLLLRTRTEMANHCFRLHQGFRGPAYYDTVSHAKWASTYMLGIAFHQTGNANLWRMLDVEAMQLLRLLEVHQLASYAGLDAVETQLRKKAFWLTFNGYMHQAHHLRNERLCFLDPALLRTIPSTTSCPPPSTMTTFPRPASAPAPPTSPPPPHRRL